MSSDARLENPDRLPPEFKDWLRSFSQQEATVLGSNVLNPHLAINNSLPWLIDVDPHMTAISHTNWDVTTVHGAGSSVHNAAKESSSAQNDAISFDVVLAAGTWTFELMHVRGGNRGIYTVSLGGSTVGTIDGYTGLGTVYNVRSTITGVNVREPVKQRLTLTMATKNVSSSSYLGSIQAIQLRRTA